MRRVLCICGKQHNVSLFPFTCQCGHKTYSPGDSPPASPSRIDICKACPHNKHGICLKFKEIHPTRACLISIGVNIPKAKCPIGKW